jgi:hypothetical protein
VLTPQQDVSTERCGGGKRGLKDAIKGEKGGEKRIPLPITYNVKYA